MSPSQFIMIAGPNGSGKSTSAPALLSDAPFLNADDIARNLPENSSKQRDFEAGRLLLAEWDRLASEGADFAIETTLASRTLVPRIHHLLSLGYEFHLVFLWLSSEDLAVGRVAERVRQGGHDIPEPIIRRRYRSGWSNLIHLYLPLAQTWRIFNNSRRGQPRRVAMGNKSGIIQIEDAATWERIREGPKDE